MTFGPRAVVIALVVSAASGAAGSGASIDPGTVPAGTYAVEPTHTRIQFSVSHMGFSDWYGDLVGARGTLRLNPRDLPATRLEITVPVASLSTTNTTLDTELKSADWLDAARFPQIGFVATAVERTAPDRASITGQLSLHGNTRQIVLDTRFNGAGINPLSKAYTVGFNATTVIKRSDFGVKADLPLVGDEVTLRISAAFEAAK